jgi:hypothetical protein
MSQEVVKKMENDEEKKSNQIKRECKKNVDNRMLTVGHVPQN